MARPDLTVDVTARITVSDEMAERCLRLLEMWQDDNADKKIIGERQEDGRTVFRIEKFSETEIISVSFEEWKKMNRGNK